MISYLEGKIIKTGDRLAIIKVGNIGWRVFLGANTLDKLQKNQNIVKIFTHLYSRDNTQELYGFNNYEELMFFEMLLGVSGVGPRHAQLIIDSIPLKQIAGAVKGGSSEVFTRVSGIGTKRAQKIIIELQNKIKVLGITGEIDLALLAEEGDAIEALKSLGYSRRESLDALNKVSKGIVGLSKRIEEALKILGGSKE